jgi:PPM family protein phosphatase
MSWIIAQAEHIGGRREQQDRYLARVSADGQRCWLVVADGMGGHSGGAMAAQAIIETAIQLWNASNEGLIIDEPPAFLWQFFSTAQQNISIIAQRQRLDPHSTCVAAYLTDKEAWFAHLGDSRLYHFRQKKFLSRTKDHSYVQMLVDLGKVTEEEMASHRDQNSLYQGLGGRKEVDLEIQHTYLQNGDSFLLCSDGFWGHVSCEQMEELFKSPATLETDLSNAVTNAVQQGGAYCDNVSVITAMFI